MNRLRSIGGRIFLLLTLSVVLTALAVSAITVVVGSRDARGRVIDKLESVVTLKENEINSWTDGLRLNLDVVLSQASVPDGLYTLARGRSDPPIREAAYHDVLERFNWAAERMGLFEELYFMDVAGVVLLSTNGAHEGQRLGLNDYFIEGLKDKFIQQPSYALSLGKMTVVASTPVVVDEETIGVLAGRASLVGLNEIMIERPGLGETGETYLVGSNFRLLTYLRRPGYSIPSTYIRTEGTYRAIELQGSGAETYTNYADTQVIGVYDWIPELQVGLIAEQEESEALRSSRIALVTMGGVAALATFFAILAGIGLTRRIVRPLAELGATAGRIADGELGLRAEVTREDEIGTLAVAFNRMTGQLGDLVQSLERRSDHLRAINESGRQISSILDLDQLLPHVARLLVQTFKYQSVRILLLTGEGHGRLLTCDEGQDCGEPVTIALHDPAVMAGLTQVVETGESTLLPGNSEEMLSEITVPIKIGDQQLGALDITASQERPLDDEDLFAAQTLADQLAVAIENSRLYEHAHELAASQERQRLARDLHDAVSQTLFSVSLIAEVLPRIYERSPEQGSARLEELRVLTRGALAEMRTLLLELRPAALADSNLPDLLKQLAEAVVGRARIPVEVRADETCEELPQDVRVAFYRIAQEALNNVVKHSGAGHASIDLKCDSTGLVLEVQDDGCGFDEHAGAGKLGMGIMRERAQSVNAHLDVSTRPEGGTRVRVVWSRPS